MRMRTTQAPPLRAHPGLKPWKRRAVGEETRVGGAGCDASSRDCAGACSLPLSQARGCGWFRSRRAEDFARTRASRRDVRRRATPDITGLCVVAARLSSAASPGEGGAALPGRAAGDNDNPQWTIGRPSRRFRLAASPSPATRARGFLLIGPAYPAGYGAAATQKRRRGPGRAVRPLSHVKQVGPGPRPVPGFCSGPSGLGDPARRSSWGAR